MATLELGSDGTVTLRLPDDKGALRPVKLRRPTVGEYRDRIEALHAAVAPVEADRLRANADNVRLFTAASAEQDEAQRTELHIAALEHSRRTQAEVEATSDAAVADWIVGTVALLSSPVTLAEPDRWPVDAVNGNGPTRIVEHWRSVPFDSTATPPKAAQK